MKKTLVAAVVVSAAALAWAGGQQVAAEVSADGHSILVRTYRCGTPSSLSLRGTAEGLVGGERRTIALEVKPGAEPGVFSVARRWPDEGRWALVLSVAGGAQVSTLVVLEPGALLRIADQRMSLEKPSMERIDAALHKGTAVATR
jgi:hypothetical protein